jgi:hypothetical protein
MLVTGNLMVSDTLLPEKSFMYAKLSGNQASITNGTTIAYDTITQ